MKNLRLFSICLLLIPALLWQCKPNKGTSTSSTSADSITIANPAKVDDFSASFDSLQKGIPVFYNMYLTVDMSRLFKVDGSAFTPEWLNPVSNAANYGLSGKKALNLGVYAVDLSYIRTYNQLEKSRPYFDAMRNLSKDLGIPDDFVVKMSDRFDKNISNKDSMMKIANEIYHTTNKYLKDNERGASSVLIILGGWTEAMSLAAHLSAEKPANTELLSKIADQKSSVSDLLSLLDENKTDQLISSFITPLQDLKNAFDKLSFDEKNPKKSAAQFKEIFGKINSLRNQVIN